MPPEYHQLAPTRRPQLSSWRRTLCTLVAVVCLALGGYGFVSALSFAKWARAPHGELFQDLSIPYTPDEVVRPLVDSMQTFDVVATVWTTKPAKKSRHSAPAGWQGPGQPVEEVIFSDTVFRGLRLRDRDVRTSVNYSFPTDILRKPGSYALRASFVLVPNLPSLLEHAVNFSSWIRPAVRYPTIRPWSDANRTLVDRIADSFAVVVPLMEAHPVFRCNGSTEAQNIIENHPHVLTRTFIRVLDMTSIYNRPAYEQAHLSLRARSCGDVERFPSMTWWECKKHFLSNGNYETMIELGMPNAATGANATAWAYAPYMDFSLTANGPLDLMPAPINRRGCPDVVEENQAVQASDMFGTNGLINVTWNISFSGRTPAELLASHRLEDILRANHSPIKADDTNHTRHDTQRHFDLFNGLSGHPLEKDDHPRIKMICKFISSGLFTVERLFASLYWYTRSSTVGISINGMALILFGLLTEHVTKAVDRGYGPQAGLIGLVHTAITHTPSILLFAFMFKTITRANFRRGSSWIPTLQFVGPTHAERASLRIESITPQSYKFMAFCTLVLVFSVCNYFQMFIITHQGLGFAPVPTKLMKITDIIEASLWQPCILIGKSLQIMMNFRCGTFGGAYRLGAWIYFVASWTLMIADTPGILYRTKYHLGLPLAVVVDFLLIGIVTWQAAIYPSVAQKKEEVAE